VNIFNSELGAKRLELLRDLLPKASRIASLVNPADVTLTETHLKDVNAAARAMGLQIQVYNADTSAEMRAAPTISGLGQAMQTIDVTAK
jgi:putative ABC transport system substrate-binding protein